jgi:hypothetical protein
MVMLAICMACRADAGGGSEQGSDDGASSSTGASDDGSSTGDPTGDDGSTSADATSDGGSTTSDTGPDAESVCAQILASGEIDGDVIVFYAYGNQIFGSALRIAADGAIFHSERTCCPPTEDEIDEAVLGAAELADLVDGLAAVAVAGETTSELGPMSEGEQTGALCAVVDGVAHTVLAHEPGNEVWVRRSSAPEADAVLALVAGYADHDLPE